MTGGWAALPRCRDVESACSRLCWAPGKRSQGPRGRPAPVRSLLSALCPAPSCRAPAVRAAPQPGLLSGSPLRPGAHFHLPDQKPAQVPTAWCHWSPSSRGPACDLGVKQHRPVIPEAQRGAGASPGPLSLRDGGRSPSGFQLPLAASGPCPHPAHLCGPCRPPTLPGPTSGPGCSFPLRRATPAIYQGLI